MVEEDLFLEKLSLYKFLFCCCLSPMTLDETVFLRSDEFAKELEAETETG